MNSAKNPLVSLVGYKLRRASASAMDELSRNLSVLGLRPTEASILLLVGANPMTRPSDVGRVLGVQRANMTPLVAGLEQRELLARVPLDKRSFGLNLTPLGRDVRAAADRVMRDYDARLLRTLSPEEAESLSELLSKLLVSDLDGSSQADELGPAISHRRCRAPPDRTN